MIQVGQGICQNISGCPWGPKEIWARHKPICTWSSTVPRMGIQVNLEKSFSPKWDSTMEFRLKMIRPVVIYWTFMMDCISMMVAKCFVQCMVEFLPSYPICGKQSFVGLTKCLSFLWVLGIVWQRGKIRPVYLGPILQMKAEVQGSWGTCPGSPGQYICLKPCTWVQNSSYLISVQSR